MQLKVERRDGRLAATYVDRGQKLPIRDFYDFGGGFYFTLLIGREGGNYREYSLKVDDDCGWLIGEGVVGDSGLTGTILFYPYPGRPRKVAVQEGPREWRPKRVTS